MTQLRHLIKAAHGGTVEEFVKSHPHPYLLMFIEDQENESQWSFKTNTLSDRRLPAEGDGHDPGHYVVFPLQKALSNPWQGRISVGRARNNDIVLPDSSVSKLHAYFLDEEGGQVVKDAGSRNGTKINDQAVAAESPQKVRSGDIVTFGALKLTYLRPEELYDLLINEFASF